MEKKQLLTIGAIAVVVLLLVLVIFLTKYQSLAETKDLDNTEESFVVKCLEPSVAYKKINSGECEPIYEDKECFKSGKVEIRC